MEAKSVKKFVYIKCTPEIDNVTMLVLIVYFPFWGVYMKLEWFAMPNNNATPVLFFLFPTTVSMKEQNGKKQIIVFFFTM